MINILKVLFLSFAIYLPAFADHHFPANVNYTTNSTSLRFFRKYEVNTLMAEISTGTSYKKLTAQSLKFGSYFKIKDGKKIGAFLSGNSGLRHTDDWVKEGVDWTWNDTSSRFETILHLNYGQRFVPKFDVPLVLEIKSEFQHNTYNEQQLLIMKPTLNYFILRKSAPKYSFHLALPFYIPLNFEENIVYKKGTYIGIMYHQGSNLQFGLSLESRVELWTDSDDFKKLKPKESYESEDTISHLKFEIIHQL